ncbi:MAG: hypothetical protein AAF891_05130 [Pseudomonadota bacterium]
MEQICLALRPGWDGTPATALSEFLALAGAPATLVLLALSLICVRLRSQWGSLALVVAWSLYASVLTMLDPGGLLAAGRAEGCVGSATLFIASVTAICVGMILYTAPRNDRAP